MLKIGLINHFVGVPINYQFMHALRMVFCIHLLYYRQSGLNGMLVCSIKHLHVSSMHLDMIMLLNMLQTLRFC